MFVLLFLQFRLHHQVLEYLLSFVIARKDTNPIAHNLINHFGSFDKVLEAPVDELVKVNGVGQVTAVFLHEFLNFYEYYATHRVKKLSNITNSAGAALYSLELLKNKTNEEFYAILLDSQGFVLESHKMAQGSKSSVHVQIRDITKYALSKNAVQVVICHNHPDTDSTPSAEDIRFTQELENALKPNGINLLEHIIVGNDDCYSFRSSYKITPQMLSSYNGRK